tara:strand:+ start:111 stop:311 length:201 start_codon:yes stop_codon:yes gene_type:complete
MVAWLVKWGGKKLASKAISSVKGKYNIGNASKIKNKAAIAKLKKSTFEANQSSKKFKEAVDKLDKK